MVSNNAKKQPNDAIYHLVLCMIILNLVICIKTSFIYIILNLTRILIMSICIYLIKQIVAKLAKALPLGGRFFQFKSEQSE
jgi:hypothetical protein